MNRPAFNILYLGINQKNKALQDLKVRQAIAYAIDKAAVVKSSLPEGIECRPRSSCPNLVEGYNDDVTEYAVQPREGQEAAQGGRRRRT